MSTAILSLFLGVLCTNGAMAQPETDAERNTSYKVDPRAWTELNIVPMPNEIRLTDDDLTLDPTRVVLAIGAKAGRQSVIGAEWINQRLAEVGGSVKLPILSGAHVPADMTVLVIGTVEDNPLIAEAVRMGIVDVGRDNPGERGYEIRRSADGQRIYLAGADPIGALYACVTFGELLEPREETVVWRAAEVRDMPDLIRMVTGLSFHGTTAEPEISQAYWTVLRNPRPSNEQRETYLEALRERVHWMLRRKVTLLSYRHLYHKGQPFEHQPWHDIIREGMEYGQERGVGGHVHSENPFVALAERYPEVAASDMGLKDVGPHGGYRRWIRCWSMDDLRRQTARELAHYIRAVGLTDVNFHDTDTGWFTNPAQWNDRCDACRERWGDDYAAATIHKHMIYVDEIKKLNPDTRLHLTIYPYNIAVLDQDSAEEAFIDRFGDSPSVREMAAASRARYSEFWRRMHAGFPLEDVTFCIREQRPPAVQALRSLMPGRGLLVGFALMTHAWRPFFSEAARWAGTFVDNPRDVFGWTTYLDGPQGLVPLEGLAVREYTWNARAPGAAPWNRYPLSEAGERWRHAEPEGEIYEIILPRITRNIFGRAAGPFIAAAVSHNVDLQQIFDHQRRQFTWLKDSERMQWQAGQAAGGARILDELWERCAAGGTQLDMDDYAFRRFVVLREQFHMGLWVARIRTQNLLAREAAARQDLEAAEQAIAEGLALLEQAQAVRDRLLEERPADPVLDMREAARWHGQWRLYTADRFTRDENVADFTPYEEALHQTRTELSAMAALHGVPEAITDALATTRIVRAHRAPENFVWERAEDDAWDAAMPIESFLVHRSREVARAHTRVRLLFDDDNLYLHATAWVPGDTELADEDTVELFLQSPALEDDYVHFFVSADGRLRQQYNTVTALAVGVKRRTHIDNDWILDGILHRVQRSSSRWEAWMLIPLAELGGAPAGSHWRINLARSSRLGNAREDSSIQPPTAAGFHTVEAYPLIHWTAEPHGSLSASIECSAFTIETMTLPEAVASVASFRVAIESDRVLHDVSLEVEAYDARGELQARRRLEAPDRVFYRWESPDEYVVEYAQVQAQGGLRFVLVCDEGLVERWIRFGGWEGTPVAGSIFRKNTHGTWALDGAFSVSDRIWVGDRDLPLLEGSEGTLEFLMTPRWEGRWPPPRSRLGEIRHGQHTLIHYGPLRRRHPTATNNSPLTLLHDATRGTLEASLRGPDYAGWSSVADLRDREDWIAWNPHHIALVWEADAKASERVRLYLNGRRVAGVSRIANPERLPDRPGILVHNQSPYPIHIGVLHSGWRRSRALLQNLRISRTARYREDFPPPGNTFSLDRDTTAFFPLNGTLEGRGMTPAGETYTLTGRAGCAGL